jgi:hypothetical protein
VGVTARLSIVQGSSRFFFHSLFTGYSREVSICHGGLCFRPIPRARADCPMPSSSPMTCCPLTRVPRYAMPNSSLHPAFAALPSAHPARGVDDELRRGPISMRVCTTCFAPSGPREVTGTLPSSTAGIASYSRALCPRRARWPASHTFGAPGAAAASHAHTTLLGASGARRCGSLDCAPWSLRASSTRPRATAAAATRAPRACGRAAHAHRN